MWGEQHYNRPLTLSGHGEVTDEQVAGYLAKYATKSTEVTGHTSTRITDANIDIYSGEGEKVADGATPKPLTHTERLIQACWRLGGPTKAERAHTEHTRLLTALARLDSHTASSDQRAAEELQRSAVSSWLTEAAAALPVPLAERRRQMPATSGSVNPWTCHTCGKVSRTLQCQVCATRRWDAEHERALVQTRWLFVLLLLGHIDPLPPQEKDPYPGLRRWAHMLGFGGHFLTTSKRYSVRFRVLREARIVFRRTEAVTPPAPETDADSQGEATVLVINSLALAGIGWHTTADAMLANTSSALAREHQQLARHLIDATAI